MLKASDKAISMLDAALEMEMDADGGKVHTMGLDPCVTLQRSKALILLTNQQERLTNILLTGY